TVGEYVNHHQTGAKYRQESVVERIQVPIAEPLQAELEHFVDCVRTQRQPLVTAEHGLRTLRLADAIRTLIKERMPDARSADGRFAPIEAATPNAAPVFAS
ncbi:Gfo/Idh/MocA family oxidoreductase, partial [Caldilinea sp.]|uniref:Gfo/Idh/MocA family oxidoreductase n=1 Tax=Caldilinea sp. TaxID=2293560 RepID=UPI002C95CC63|nr:hypothetical protein [Caldilinea sp.]